jgi:phage terminase small subunit
MPALNNPKHEMFAQYLAQGKTQDEAYELCGYKPSRSNASHLSDKQSIRDRVHQLTTKIVTATATATAKKAAFTLESLIQRHDAVYERALEGGQYPAATNANKEISILTGHRVERAEIGSPGEFESMQDDELERVLIERLGALGFSLSPIAEDGEDGDPKQTSLARSPISLT